MPIKSSAINLKGMVCLVYEREKARTELAWLRACFIASQDHGNGSDSLSDDERSIVHAVAHRDAPLDFVVKDERLGFLFYANGWYKQARAEKRKDECRKLGLLPFAPTSWKVMRDFFVRAAQESSPHFWLGSPEDLNESFTEFCERLLTGKGTPDEKYDRAFVALEGYDFRDKLSNELHDKCIEELRFLGLGEPPDGGQLAATAPNNGNPSPDDVPPGIDAESRRVLLDLLQHKPVLRKTVELEAALGISRKTVGDRLNELIEHGYAIRPKGKNTGATIAPAGEDLAKGFPNSTH